MEHGFDGIEWSFTPRNFPRTRTEIAHLVKIMAGLEPLEVRFHAALPGIDPSHNGHKESSLALDTFKDLCRLTADLGGTFLTFHLGLGFDSTLDLSWERGTTSLQELIGFARNQGVTLCLENLAWGWTSKPNLYEKILRNPGLAATLDIGHASVSEAVQCGGFHFEDFTLPHPDRFVGAHIYHLEEDERHLPPTSVKDLSERLSLLLKLPRCNWWLLELREEADLLRTLAVVRSFLNEKTII